MNISTGSRQMITSALSALLLAGSFSMIVLGQTRTVAELSSEIDNYVTQRARALASEGKRVDSAKRDELARDKKVLAGKYAEQVAARSDLKGADLYYVYGYFHITVSGNNNDGKIWLSFFNFCK